MGVLNFNSISYLFPILNFFFFCKKTKRLIDRKLSVFWPIFIWTFLFLFSSRTHLESISDSLWINLYIRTYAPISIKVTLFRLLMCICYYYGWGIYIRVRTKRAKEINVVSQLIVNWHYVKLTRVINISKIRSNSAFPCPVLLHYFSISNKS